MILHGEEAREKLMQGVDLVADTVVGTLGPKAKTVVIKQNGRPVVINDGVTIAKAVFSDDPFIQMGVELVQEVASQAQNKSGDGTTTSIILARELCRSGLKDIKAGIDPVLLKKELDSVANDIIEHLNSIAKPVNGRGDLENVATIAANNDAELGLLIADIVEEIGKDGVISVEDGQNAETTYSVIDGMELDRGYVHHVMVNKPDEGYCEFEDALVLMTNDTLNNFEDIYNILDMSVKEKKPLLIIAKEIEGSALNNILLNLAGERIRACAIRAPDWGDDQVEVLNDISTLLGGKVFNSTVGDDFSKAKLEDLGIATKVRVSRTTTMLINDNAIQEHINERVALLSSQLDNQTNDWFREKIHRRIGKLTGGVAVVKVGAATETELRERKERLDDALNATKCAVQEGIVVGGGMALYDWVLKQKPSPINSAFSAPTNVIASNAGVSLNSNKLLEGLGFNANTNKYQNLLEAGVIDPVKVTKNAVLTATSIAGLVLTTNVLVGEKEEPQWG
tara:strand:- start:885 stop:2411 length:1527 start_codon:yes stop_codon:yes gene_type:complete